MPKSTPASLRGLLTWIEQHPAYQKLNRDLSAGLEIPAYNLLSQAQPAIIAALIKSHPEPVLVITPTVEQERRLQAALRLWMNVPSRLLPFPEPPGLLYERVPWPPEVITDRLDVLSRLVKGQIDRQTERPAPVILTSTRALMHRTLPYRQFRRAIRKVSTGAQESLQALTRHAHSIGYEPVSIVQAPGQLSQRGGLLDIFPPQSSQPYRLEFFGEEIDTIRTFAPETQRSTGRSRSFWLTPVREALPRDSERALSALDQLIAQNPPEEIRARLEEDREALATQSLSDTLEFYMPYLYDEVGTLFHYLPPETLTVIVDAEQLAIRWRELEKEAKDQRENAVREGTLLPDAPVPYVMWERIEALIQSNRPLQLTAGEEGPLAEMLTPEPHFAGRLPETLGRIRQWVGLGDQVVVASRQAPRMADLWQEFNAPPVKTQLTETPDSLITFVKGAANGGWQWNGPAGIRHLLTDAEIFGWRPPEPRRRPRRRATAPEYTFADLEPGDYVVHEDYGIGVFRGLVTRSFDEIDREYLLLEYAAPRGKAWTREDSRGTPEARRDKLFVPIHQADRLTRYVGTEGLGPRLSRLGTGTWERTKERVREAADTLAAELLELYATRQVVKGHAFASDSTWQKELEAAFPYVETQDQVDAIEAVKSDMEQPQPMDRLICGDAGYGKTEVALRAAFKAVMDNKQVAMLVPTTVLAQQHYETFLERLAPFPIHLELLSRFRTDAEQAEVLEELQEGTVDIVIGTHRLLQRDVSFQDLGLVIIDEEQRFGVAHKEQLKQIRTEVDVLTLTATPIPRTLYMALTGVRDISIIETPPQERLPIATYVGPYDTDVVRRAIQREVNRGGQVFYVHNRVRSIQSVASRLEALVPETEIAVAHGQMHEKILSDVMEKFSSGDVDVLLATTIIESGLDYPNANTLIVERADRFGLAQLYQLRGRIGRGSQRGYAYFFHPRRRTTEESQQRLLALRETTSQGGGFTVALRDLEIRGAGDLLGKQQHGHVAAVGFTLYTRILNRAVRQLKAKQAGEPPPPEPIGSITLELPLAVGLPPEYVPDDKLRLQLYRRLAELENAEQIAELHEELEDRFGPLPEMAENMIYQLNLKVLARDARVDSVVVKSGQIAIYPPWLPRLDRTEVSHLRHRLSAEARVGRRGIWLPISWEQRQWQDNLKKTLETLGTWAEAHYGNLDITSL
jgi:transcription-repair coupling factor (superfamily II helicase)